MKRLLLVIFVLFALAAPSLAQDELDLSPELQTVQEFVEVAAPIIAIAVVAWGVVAIAKLIYQSVPKEFVDRVAGLAPEQTITTLRTVYEGQMRALNSRIDELQAELRQRTQDSASLTDDALNPVTDKIIDYLQSRVLIQEAANESHVRDSAAGDDNEYNPDVPGQG